MKFKHKILATGLIGIASFGIVSESTFANNVHTVAKGENLYRIALQYKTTVKELESINNLTSNNLYIGQKLIISKNSTNNTVNSNAKMVNANSLNLRNGAGTNFKVLTSIPNKSIVNVISNSNGWSKVSYKNFVGYVSSDFLVNITSDTKPNTNTNTKPNTNTNTKNSYTVVKGDTLFSISKKHNVSVNDIKEWNKLNSTDIFVGQVLSINVSSTSIPPTPTPTPTPTPIVENKSYSAIVISSDNLNLRSSFSTNSNILTSIPPKTIISISEENDGWGKTVFNGKTGYVSLKYVSKNISESVDKNTTEQPKDNTYLKDLVYDKNDPYFNISNQYHIVEKGDTLNSISKKYNIPLNNLLSINKLSSSLINIGDLIVISKNSPFILPSNGTYTSEYGSRWGTVHYGVDIANRNDVPVNAAYGGVVERVENKDSKSGWGNYVRIKHTINGKTLYTLYAHLKESSIQVKVGQTVKTGEKIAMMGNTGNSTGQHLHLEIYEGGNTYSKDNVNPLKYFFLK